MSLLERERVVLVVVDAQPGFLGKGESAAALDRMVWVAAVAVRLAVPVVVTEEEPERHGATHSRIVEQLPAATPRLRKPTFGLAGTPEILAAVRSTKRQTALLIGCETDVCVAQSAIGLREAGFRSVVVEDATFSPGEMHERGLARLAGAGVERNHAKGVTYELLRTVEDAHAVLRDAGLADPPFQL
jgi:nicotinamidase-related amidase